MGEINKNKNQRLPSAEELEQEYKSLSDIPDLTQVEDGRSPHRGDRRSQPSAAQKSHTKAHYILQGSVWVLMFVAGVLGGYQFGKKHENRAIIDITQEVLPASAELDKLVQNPSNYYHKVYLSNSGEEDANSVEFDVIFDLSSSQLIYYKNSFIPKKDVAIAGKRVKVLKVRRYKLIPVVLVGTVQKGGIEIQEIKVEPSGIFKSGQPRDYSSLVLFCVIVVAIILYVIDITRILRKTAGSSFLAGT